MIYKKTFTNGKPLKHDKHIVSSRIPVLEFNQIIQTKLSAETIIVLLNEKENLYSYRQKNSLVWRQCLTCQKIFLTYRRAIGHYCSMSCCGKAKTYLKKYSANGLGKKCPNKGMKMEKNPAWKGGLTYHKRKGKYANQSIKYIRCPKAYLSMSRKDGYVMEHRIKIALEIKRPLLRTECVHHINHDATDNRIKNLMLFKTNKDHKRYEWGQDIKPLWQQLLQ